MKCASKVPAITILFCAASFLSTAPSFSQERTESPAAIVFKQLVREAVEGDVWDALPDAIEELKALPEKFPDDPVSHSVQAMVAAARDIQETDAGELKAAEAKVEEAIGKALAAGPDNHWNHIARAAIFVPKYLKGDLTAVGGIEKETLEARKLSPETSEPYWLLWFVYKFLKPDSEKAAKAHEAAARFPADLFDPHYFFFMAESLFGDCDAAVAEVKNAKARQPKAADTFLSWAFFENHLPGNVDFDSTARGVCHFWKAYKNEVFGSSAAREENLWKAMESAPQSKAREDLAYFLAEKGRREEAEKLVLDFFNANPTDLGAALALADFYAGRGNNADKLAETMKRFPDIRSDSFNDPHSYKQVGQFYLQVQDAAKAEAVLRVGAESFPDDIYLQMELARLIKNAEPENALAMLKKILEKPGLKPHEAADVREEMATIYLETGRRAEAKTMMEGLYDAFPEDAGAAVRVASFYEYNLRDRAGLKKHLARLDEAVFQEPDSAFWLANLADFHAKVGDFQRAESLLRGLLEQDPADSHATEQLIDLVKFDRPEEAARLIEAQLERKDLNANDRKSAIDKLLIVYVEIDPTKAVAEAKKRIGSETDNGTKARLYVKLSGLLDASDDLDAALAAAREAYGLDPGDQENSVDQFVSVLQEMRSFDEALSVLETAASKTPDDWRKSGFYSTSGFIYERLGKYEEAIEAQRKAFEREPNAEWTFEGIATLQLKLNRPDEALETYDLALKKARDEGNRAEISLRKADLLLKQGNNGGADEAALEAMKSGAKARWTLENAANTFRRTRGSEATKALFTERLGSADNPQERAALLGAMARIADGPDEKESLLRQSVAAAPAEYDALAKLCDHLAAMGRIDEALTEIDAFIQSAGEDPMTVGEASFWAARSLAELYRLPEAADRILAAGDANLRRLGWFGRQVLFALVHEKGLEAAAELLDRQADRNRMESWFVDDFRLQKAFLYAEAEKFEETERICVRLATQPWRSKNCGLALAIQRNDYDKAIMLADREIWEQGRVWALSVLKFLAARDGAAELYEAKLAEETDLATNDFAPDASSFFSLMGSKSHAREIAKKILDGTEEKDLAFDSHAPRFAMLGDATEVQALIEKNEAENGASFGCRFHYGQALFHSGDRAAARPYFEECLDVWDRAKAPETPQRVLATAYLGNVADAKKRIAGLLDAFPNDEKTLESCAAIFSLDGDSAKRDDCLRRWLKESLLTPYWISTQNYWNARWLSVALGADGGS